MSTLYEAQASAVTTADLQASRALYVTGTGTADAYLATPHPPNIAPVAGTLVYLRIPAEATNTGASSLSLSGLAPADIVHADGSAMQAGELAEGGIYALMFDGAAWQVLGLPVPAA